MRAYFGNSNLRGDLTVFASGFIQVFLGHITEAPLLALALFVLILIGNKFSSKFIRALGLVTVISSTICLIIAISLYSIYDTNRIFFLISLTPALAFIFGISVKYMYSLMSKHTFIHVVIYSRSFLNKILKKLKIFLSILLVYIYGLMLIAYWIRPKWINWSIATLWYSPAVEWGFLGLVFIFTLARLGLEEEKIQDGFKFVIILFILQLVLLVVLNYWNYYHFYLATPYPLQPVLFLPLLALVASQGFAINKSKKIRYRLKMSGIITLIILLIFSFGSLDHVLSASFWKTNSGWWLNSQLNPSHDDYELINFLYKNSPISVYEFVLTFHHWENPSSYVVYPSGMAILSGPLIDIAVSANDSREIYILSYALPIRYVLVSVNESLNINSYLVRVIKAINPVFKNSKYMLYLLSQFNLSETSLLPNSKDFLTVDKIIFEGNLTLMDENDIYNLYNSKGEILPLGEGNILVKAQLANGAKLNFTATISTIKIRGNLTLIKMKSTWGYFREIKCSAERIIISGESSFKIFNTFKNRIYIESFNYDGKYKAYPFPTYLRQDYAKEMIEYYWKVNHENPLDVLTSPYGIVWTLIIIVLIVYKLAPLYMLIAKNRQNI